VTTDATRGHIDAETLAAWTDHSLPADAAAAVELHLSNCDRCQEVLAAFVRSEPAAGAVILPFWSRRPIQWSAAGLAAAAAIVAMIYIGRPPTAPEPVTTVAQQEIDALRPVAPLPAPTATKETAAEPAARSLDDRAARLEKSTIGAAEARADKKIAAPKPAAEAALPGVAAPPPAVPPSPPTTAPVTTMGQQGAAAATPPPPPTVSVSESAFRDMSSTFEVVPPDLSFAMARRADAAAARGAGGGGRGGAAGSTAATRWRVTGGTLIERTTDAGKTWTAMELQPALTTRLTAGAATSPVVCWFVGANGVVLVTTDGRTLRRMSVPETVTLMGVTAEDGLRATVFTADGRRFTTIDGGLTWKGSQEF
jgi:hypothetical protein